MSNSMSVPRWKIQGLAFAFWTLLAGSYTASAILSSISEGMPAAS